MKIGINSLGVLVILSEKGVEIYALQKWLKDNYDPEHGTLSTDAIAFDHVSISVFSCSKGKH